MDGFSWQVASRTITDLSARGAKSLGSFDLVGNNYCPCIYNIQILLIYNFSNNSEFSAVIGSFYLFSLIAR